VTVEAGLVSLLSILYVFFITGVSLLQENIETGLTSHAVQRYMARSTYVDGQIEDFPPAHGHSYSTALFSFFVFLNLAEDNAVLTSRR
jgi:hypothetical protein